MYKLVTITSLWFVATVLFYAFACYLSFEYRRAHEYEYIDHPILQVKPKNKKQVLGTIVLVAVGMTLLIFLMINLFDLSSGLFTNLNKIVTFLIFMVFPSLFAKREKDRKLFLLGGILFASVATYVWLSYPNWITNNFCAFAAALIFLVSIRNINYRQCAALSVGIMAFDFFAVFYSMQMQKLAQISGNNSGAMIVIPEGISPEAQGVLATGVGDLVFPGLIIMLAYRTYGKLGAAGSISGYLLGMIITLAVLFYSDFPQPATIYLIPMTYAGFGVATLIKKREVAIN